MLAISGVCTQVWSGAEHLGGNLGWLAASWEEVWTATKNMGRVGERRVDGVSHLVQGKQGFRPNSVALLKDVSHREGGVLRFPRTGIIHSPSPHSTQLMVEDPVISFRLHLLPCFCSATVNCNPPELRGFPNEMRPLISCLGCSVLSQPNKSSYDSPYCVPCDFNRLQLEVIV